MIEAVLVDPIVVPYEISSSGKKRVYAMSGTAGKFQFASSGDDWRRDTIQIKIDLDSFNPHVEGTLIHVVGMAHPTAFETNGHDHAGWAVDNSSGGIASPRVAVIDASVAVKGKRGNIMRLGFLAIIVTEVTDE